MILTFSLGFFYLMASVSLMFALHNSIKQVLLRSDVHERVSHLTLRVIIYFCRNLGLKHEKNKHFLFSFYSLCFLMLKLYKISQDPA